MPAHHRVAPELTLAAHARPVESVRHAVLVGAGEHARAHRQPHERSDARALVRVRVRVRVRARVRVRVRVRVRARARVRVVLYRWDA